MAEQSAGVQLLQQLVRRFQLVGDVVATSTEYHLLVFVHTLHFRYIAVLPVRGCLCVLSRDLIKLPADKSDRDVTGDHLCDIDYQSRI